MEIPPPAGQGGAATGMPIRLLLIERIPEGADDYLSVLLGPFNPSPVDWFHARSLGEALARLSEYEVDGILFDAAVPEVPVREMISQIGAAAPKPPIVVLAEQWDDALMRQAIRAGAQDYLLKGETDGLLIVRAFHMAIERKSVRS